MTLTGNDSLQELTPLQRENTRNIHIGISGILKAMVIILIFIDKVPKFYQNKL